MYDKLGELLSESLENETIYKKTEEIPENEQDGGIKSQKNHYTKEQKLHKYTENIQFSSQISSALTTLDIAYPFSVNDIKKQYRKLLKKYHPDTSSNNNTIQDTKIVDKLRQLQIEKIQTAYETLKAYFKFE